MLMTSASFEGVGAERGEIVLPQFQPVEGKLVINAGPSRAGAHDMNTHEICPRMRRLARDERAEPKVAGKLKPTFYLDRGSLVHVGLAHWNALRAIREQGVCRVGDLRVTDPGTLYEPIEAIHVAAALNHSDVWSALGEAEMLTRRYIEWDQHQPSPWHVLAVEVEVGILIDPGELYTARLDMLVRDRTNGLVYGVDHKTAYYPRDAPAMYGHGYQMLGIQEIGTQLYGGKWGGIILNCIASAKTATTPVVRLSPKAAPALQARYLDHLRQQRREMRAEDKLPLNQVPFRLSSCWRDRDGPCPMHKVCGVRV